MQPLVFLGGFLYRGLLSESFLSRGFCPRTIFIYLIIYALYITCIILYIHNNKYKIEVSGISEVLRYQCIRANPLGEMLHIHILDILYNNIYTY